MHYLPQKQNRKESTMPTKRIVAFVIAILITLISFLTVFMQTACIVAQNDFEGVDTSPDSDMHPAGVFLVGITSFVVGFYGLLCLAASINFSIVSLILALSNTKPERCEVKGVRITSWVIFGINCAVIAYSIIAIFFI